MPFVCRFDGSPADLKHLLRQYSGGVGEAGRKALYKRVYGILWVNIMDVLYNNKNK